MPRLPDPGQVLDRHGTISWQPGRELVVQLLLRLDEPHITRQGKRVRFYSTVDLINALEQEKAQGKAGRIASGLLRMDPVIPDELG